MPPATDEQQNKRAEWRNSLRSCAALTPQHREPPPGSKCVLEEGRVWRREKRRKRPGGLTLLAAEEDSDIISRQLLHFSVAVSSLCPLLSPRKPHSCSRSGSPTARLVVVGEVVFSHVASCFLCCWLLSMSWPGPWRAAPCGNFFCLRVFVCVCFGVYYLICVRVLLDLCVRTTSFICST